jgi:hypothetical protein
MRLMSAHRASAVTARTASMLLLSATGSTLPACADDCASSTAVLIIPEVRAATVVAARTSGPCEIVPRRDCGIPCTRYFIEGTGRSGMCQVTVAFNDGSPPYEGEVLFEHTPGCCTDGCILDNNEVLQVPEKE